MSVDRAVINRLRDVLDYNPGTGVFVWSVQKPGRLKAGARAGTARKPDGYRSITVDYVRRYEHHIAWAFTYGFFPEGEIDHKDGDPSNNSAVNLRLATRSENEMNKPIPCTNTSGAKGITWVSARSLWQAQITFGKKNHFLGRFPSFDEAVSVRKAAERRLFGEFTR